MPSETPEADPGSKTQPALVRSGLYSSLAVGFRYPSPEAFESFRSGDFASDLRQGFALVPHLKELSSRAAAWRDRVGTELTAAEFQDFEVEYVQTFDVGFPEPPCPPYEGIYRTEERTATLVEVSQFYKHFGLRMSPAEDKRELPDYLPAELEFMHFLALKEAQGREEKTEELLQGYLRAQRDFLRLHLGQWLPPFCGRLEKAPVGAFYRGLAGLAQEVVRRDLSWLAGLLPAVDGPLRGPPGSAACGQAAQRGGCGT